MSAFDQEALWNKSRLFADRALRARDESDDLEYHLWAALALELLGKATLAHIHPALVADPSDFKSLLAACGRQTVPNVKSITSKTVFERLRSISSDFDDRTARECMLMATRRNAEVHSGESPVAGLDPRAWVPGFWRAASIMLHDQERTLSDWVGVAEAGRVEAILADTAEVMRQAVLGRIERRRADFNRRCPAGSLERRDAEQRAAIRAYPGRIAHQWDGYDTAACPACGLRAWLLGQEYDREVTDERYESEGPEEWDYRYVQLVRVTYTSESFACSECSLRLDGSEEIEIAELPAEFEDEVEDEPEYDEYGNE